MNDKEGRKPLAAFFPIYYSEIYPQSSNSQLLQLFYHKITVCQEGFENFFQKILIFFNFFYNGAALICVKGLEYIRIYIYKVDKSVGIYYN